MTMEDDNVITLDMPTTLDIPADRVLTAAVGKMQSVMVIGYDLEDEEYFASSTADRALLIWWLERAKHKLLVMADGD